MPEAITTLATVWSLMTFATAVHDGEIDLYLNGNKIAQEQQERRKEIIEDAQERQHEILLASQRVLSQTTLR